MTFRTSKDIVAACAASMISLSGVVDARASVPSLSATELENEVPSMAKRTANKTWPAAVEIERTRTALGLPLANRLRVLRGQGPAGYRNLVKIMFSAAESMDMRWRAVIAVGRLGGVLSLPEIERALRGREWFMRNAGLVAIAQISGVEARQWARQLLSDRALVVRAAAVDTLERLNDRDSSQLLWSKLYARENYMGEQSLFIRRRIVEVLARFEGKGREGKFIEILADKDESLHAPAISALERITENSLGKANEPLRFRRAQWQRWWKEKAQAKL